MKLFNKYAKENEWQTLHTQGNKLYNAKGEPVRIVGINCGPLVWTSNVSYLMENVEVACDRWRANTIRLPMSQDRWFGFGPEQEGYDESGERYRAEVDSIVEAVAARNKYVILDLHRSNVNTWGEFISGGLPDMNSLVFWKSVAVRYCNHPNVLFDLYNEPFQVTWDQWKNGGEITVYYAQTDIGQQIMFEKNPDVDMIPLTYWNEPFRLMSLVGFLTLRSREHINGFLAFFPKTTFKETNRPTITPVFYILHIV